MRRGTRAESASKAPLPIEGRRGFRTIHLVAMIVASMVGSGVFTTSGFALAELGTRQAVLGVWALAAVVALLGALSYSWMAQIYPESGGEYVLLGRALHPSAGYVAGWVSMLAGFTAPIAATAHGIEAYLQQGDVMWIGTLVIVLCTAMHAWHRERGANVHTLIVGTNLTLLFALVIFGVVHLGADTAGPTLKVDGEASTRWENFGPTFVLISYSYLGWNAAIYLAGELRTEKRNLSRAGLYAVSLVALLYLGLNAVILYLAPTQVLSGRADVAFAAVTFAGGRHFAVLLSGLVAAVMATSVSALITSGARVMWKMSRDGALPPWIGACENGPRRALALQGALALTAFWASSLSQLLGYIGLTLSLFATLTAGSLFFEWRRGTFPFSDASMRSPWLLLVPGTFVLVSLVIVTWASWQKPGQAFAGAATMTIGLVFWQLKQRRQRKRQGTGRALA